MDQFIRRKSFPGTTGNPFDVILHKTAEFERTPIFIFFLFLAALSALPLLWDWRRAAVIFAFVLLDWYLFRSLPRYKKSFGPYKTSVLILAFGRLVLSLLPFWIGLGLNLAGSLLTWWGTWIEPHRIHVTNQELVSRKLPEGFRLRLLHLADLHIERLTARELQLNDIIEELAPDVILFSGDFLNLSYLKDHKALSDLHRVVAGWRAPMGIYAVTGSPAVDLPELIPALTDGSQVRLLQNEVADIKLPLGEVRIVGLTCSHMPHVDGPVLEELVDHQAGPFQILLYHTPDLAPLAAKAGMDLQLSGHTHGGQIRLPLVGALATGSLFGKKFEAGRYQVDKMVLYVSRGIGMEGLGAPRARLFCPPEVILWEILGSKT